MPYLFRLLDPDGNDLGPLASRRCDWQPGERVSRWHGEELEIIRVVDHLDEVGFHGYIVVRPVEDSKGASP